MHPSIAASPVEALAPGGEIAAWDLDPTLPDRLRAVVADAASLGTGARLVITSGSRLRPLVSVSARQYPWRTPALSALERGEASVANDVVAVPVGGPTPAAGALVIYLSEAAGSAAVLPVARAHAAHLASILSTVSVVIDIAHRAAAALHQALSAHDTETGRHSHVLRGIARRIGEALDLGPRDLIDLEWAALLHDLGKLTIPATILQQTEPLTQTEWALMRQHPTAGEHMVSPIPALTGARAAIRHHHERWDGRGYPDRLAGTTIPLNARIICVADAFETMCTGRPYRSALTRHEAVEELRRHAGAQFDPTIVPVMASLATSFSS